ncbi:hypothetical protein ACFP1Z_30805 [Streptomyces gamaensis]|uniref:Lipoprotein n=1 Tax=Streptomyces gamaensis TaxID=1763542 RepID=A0ABW0Z9T5_9ACTN
MLPTTPRTRRRHLTAVLLATAALGTALTGCGEKDSGDTKASDQVPSLQKGDAPGSAAPSAAKKYKEGSPELKKAQDAFGQAFNTCVTRTAQKLGIETRVLTEGKDKGSIAPKEDMGPVTFKANHVIEGSELGKKWYTQVVDPCKKEVPAPQVEDDGDKGKELAEAKKKYECLSKAGLSDLHEPTEDNTALFTSEGMAKYFSGSPDPKSKEILQKCGIGGGS